MKHRFFFSAHSLRHLLLALLPVLLFALGSTGSALAKMSDTDDPELPDFLLLSFAPQYQALQRYEGRNGNYELNFIGVKTLRQGNERIGDSRIVWWWMYARTYSGTSTKALSKEAGLLWGINDGDGEEPFAGLGLLALQQAFARDRLILYAGKLYPGVQFLESEYWGDDRATFLSEIISAEAAGRWFNNVGLGLKLRWAGERGYVQGGVIDAQAQDDYLDFQSLSKGRFMWIVEFGYQPDWGGNTQLQLAPYVIDATDTLSRETALVAGLTHEWGEHAVFGRYTWRNGGEGVTPDNADEELRTRRGGFIGYAWNRPFNRANDQLAIALMRGEPTALAAQDGYETQHGLEIYWAIQPAPWLIVTPDLQLVQNRDGELETILGVRLKLKTEW